MSTTIKNLKACPEYKEPTGAGDVTWDKNGRLVLPLTGSVLRYDAPTEPVVPPEAWDAIGAATREEPMPDGDGADVARLVQEDIEKRAEEGRRKYGERLTTGNGRDALVDAYQEALDLCMYLRQKIEEERPDFQKRFQTDQ